VPALGRGIFLVNISGEFVVLVLQNVTGCACLRVRVCMRQSGWSDAMNYRASSADISSSSSSRGWTQDAGDEREMKMPTMATSTAAAAAARLAPFGGVVMSTVALSQPSQPA